MVAQKEKGYKNCFTVSKFMIISLYKKCGNFAYFFSYYSLKIAGFEADGPIRVIYFVFD